MDLWPSLVTLTIFLNLLAGLCQGHQGDHVPNLRATQNKEHIQDHLDGVVKKKTGEMSNEELQFHYFKAHDIDENNKLDGLEIVSAMTHFHDDEKSNDHENPPGATLSDSQIENMVDQILKDDDLNNDGYIDFSEYFTAQKQD